MDTQSAPPPVDLRASSLAPTGFMLGGLSILALVVLSHHPVAHGGTADEVLASIRTQATADRLVHGALAINFGLQTAAMFVFASRLGVWRLTVLAGLVSFSCGAMLLVLAAMTDGFVVPAIVGGCGPSPSCLAQATPLLRLSGLQIEALSRFALVAVAIAVAAWSGALLMTPATPRWAGSGGLCAAAVLLAALIASGARLSAHTLMPVMAAEIAWCLIVAALMILQPGPFAGAGPPRQP